MTSTVPFFGSYMTVESDWIDYNGHLNMAYYNVLFDCTCDVAFKELGLGESLASSRRRTTYTAEAHIHYLREIHAGDRVRGTFQILDYDRKSLHIYQELHHESDWISATSEVLALHIDMDGPRVTTFDDDIYARVEEMAALHSGLPRPDYIGRPIGIRRKDSSAE